MKVEFYKHNLEEDDKKECLSVLNSLFLTTGETVKTFENKLAGYLGAKYAIGVTSCTDALFLCLKCLNVGAGDEIITTPLSFIATANSVEYCGARPVFVDVEKETGNINVNLIEAAITSKTKAILVVHLYGQMCDMKAIKKIADKHNLKIIEDCAHCIEGERDGIKPGQLSDFACFSFYATKNITCGEGGAIVCNNEEYYSWLMKARLHGMSKNAADRYNKMYQHYDMEFLGYKSNMNNISAALLVHQIDRVEELLAKKEIVSKKYDAGFKNNNKLKTPQVLNNSKHARHLYTIWVDKEKRDDIMHSLQELHIGVAVNFRVIHLMKYYREKYGFKEGDFEQAEKIGAATITLPFYPKLLDEEIEYVISSVNKFVS